MLLRIPYPDVAAAVTRRADFTTGAYNGITPVNSNSTGGYAETVAGTLTFFGANTLRRTNKGLLIEPSSTNALLQSVDLSQAPWATFNNNDGRSSITPAQSAPDGSSTAVLFSTTRDTAGNNGYGILYQNATAINTSSFGSIYLKAGSAADVGQGMPFYIRNMDSGTNTGMGILTLTNTWKRFDLGALALSTGGGGTQFAIGHSAQQTDSSIGTVTAYVWGADIESGSASTSLILTTTATGTRSADAVSFTVPTGVTQLKFTFDDNSTQTATVASGSTYTVPTSLSRPYIKYIDG